MSASTDATESYEAPDDSDGGLKVYAHRGWPQYAAQNTMESIRRAIEDGVYGVEIDFWALDNDDKYPVFHDPTLSRLTDGEGNIYEQTQEDLSNLNVYDTDGNPSKDIPMLSEALDVIAEYIHDDTYPLSDVRLHLKTENIEGTGIAEDITEYVVDRGLKDAVHIQSFSLGDLQQFDNLKKAYLTETPEQDIKDAAYAGVDSFEIPVKDLTEGVVEKVKENDMKVGIWPEDAKKIDSDKLDGLLYKEPDHIGINSRESYAAITGKDLEDLEQSQAKEKEIPVEETQVTVHSRSEEQTHDTPFN